MRLPVKWKPEARADLRNIIAYLADHSPSAAPALRKMIEASVIPATEHFYLYRRGRVAGTREIVVHPNYLVVYRVTDTAIEIVNVLHARQRYPK